MTNLTTPNGFQSRNLTKWSRYYVPQSDTNIYRAGDVVRSGSGSDTNGVPTVLPHTGSGAMRGVIVSVDPGLPATGGLQSDGQKLYVPAIKTRGYYLWVNDDPAATFNAVDDGLTPANLVAANVGTFVNFTPGAGATANGGSTAALTSSTFGGASGSGCWKVLQLNTGASYGAYASWIVQPANHELAQGGGGGAGGGITAIAQASDYNTAQLPAQASAITAAATAAGNAQTSATSAATAAGNAQTTANAAQTTANAAAVKAGQSFYLTFYVPTVADGDLVKIPVDVACTITKVSAVSAAGTTTLTPKIGSTAMTGGALNVTTTKGSSSPSANNVAAQGNDLVFTASSSSSCTGLAVTVTYTRNLA
jgi:hypothetical protein